MPQDGVYQKKVGAHIKLGKKGGYTIYLAGLCFAPSCSFLFVFFFFFFYILEKSESEKAYAIYYSCPV
jgi:hypothetical protein